MRVGIGQINPCVGEIDANASSIIRMIEEGKRRPGFVRSCEEAIERIRLATGGIAVVVGSVSSAPKRGSANRFDLSSLSDGGGIDLFNVAYLIEDRTIVGEAAKMHLPAYDVYNEKRYFTPGPGTGVEEVGRTKIGINICEDLLVDGGPSEVQASLGAEWIVNVSASPFYRGKPVIRLRMADLQSLRPMEGADEDETAQVRRAIVLGIRDYFRKNRFASAIVGLSGGIDSALVAALAAEAIGAGNVTGVFMESEFSSPESRDDAREVARRLGIGYLEIPIERMHREFRAALPGGAEGLVDENLQPRIRATLLMGLANSKNALVLSAGNKSEIAIGYNTLYGDTVGALAPIADLYKEDVYRLAESLGERIPERVLTKPPSAELREGQRDEDDLPPYSVLDPLLRSLIERNGSREELVANGFEERLVDDVIARYRRSEYKRRQLPPGIKVTPKAFGIGRIVPLTDRYRD